MQRITVDRESQTALLPMVRLLHPVAKLQERDTIGQWRPLISFDRGEAFWKVSDGSTGHFVLTASRSHCVRNWSRRLSPTTSPACSSTALGQQLLCSDGFAMAKYLDVQRSKQAPDA